MDDHANREHLEGHMPFQCKPPRREQLMMPLLAFIYNTRNIDTPW
jgi:hypothetical protein